MTSKTNINNPESPYYLCSADQPGNIIGTVCLDGDNYSDWRRVVVNALKSKNKLSFVDGILKKPDATSPDVHAWEKCNSMVIAWLYNVIDKRLHKSIDYGQTAAAIWKELEERYAQPNSIRIYQIKEDITLAKQGKDQSVTDYYTHLKALWDELGTCIPTPVCTCDCECKAVKLYNQNNEDEKVHKFLMGLDPECYLNARSAILAIEPLPSLNKAYAIVIREERQRLCSPTTENRPLMEAAAFKASSSRTPQGLRPKCSYCQKLGHERNHCFELVGYPSNWADRRLNRPISGGTPATSRHYGYGGRNRPAAYQGTSSQAFHRPPSQTSSQATGGGGWRGGRASCAVGDVEPASGERVERGFTGR